MISKKMDYDEKLLKISFKLKKFNYHTLNSKKIVSCGFLWHTFSAGKPYKFF